MLKNKSNVTWDKFRNRNVFWYSVFNAVTLCLLVSCSTVKSDDSLSGATPNPRMQLTDEQKLLAQEVEEEVAVGRALAAKLLGTFGNYDQDAELLKYVNLVGGNLAAQVGRPEIQFYFGILDSEEENAFALPGGYILLTRGLMKKIQSESEMANVLAHEIAHVNQRHMYNEIRPKRTVGGAESLVRILSRGSSDISGSLTDAINRGMALLLDKGISHKLEYEADEVGVIYASQVGYNPVDLGLVLERLQNGQSGKMMSKTHPPFTKRIQRLNFVMSHYAIPKVLRARSETLESRFKLATRRER